MSTSMGSSLLLLLLIVAAVAGGWLALRRLRGAGRQTAHEPNRLAASGDAQPPRQADGDAALATLGRLTGSAAHDFNNLLGIVSNNTHLLYDDATDEEARELLASTLSAVEAGSQLTRQLLRLASRGPAQPQRIELMRTLPEVLELLQGVAGSRMTFAAQVEPDTLPVFADSGGLELALLSLALDARDAMPRGGSLRLHASHAEASDAEGLPPLAPPRRWMRLTVTGDSVSRPAGEAPRMRQVHAFCEEAGGTARYASGPGGLGAVVTLLLPSAP